MTLVALQNDDVREAIALWANHKHGVEVFTADMVRLCTAEDSDIPPEKRFEDARFSGMTAIVET